MPSTLSLQASKLQELHEREQKFRRACEQIIVLDMKRIDLKRRYDYAVRQNRREWRHLRRRYDYAVRQNRREWRRHLHLRLAIVDGVRNVYYDYAEYQAEEIDALHTELWGVPPDSDDIDEW